ILGTVGYMSPEQVLGRPADHRSDIFALGAILYEMLSGRRAYARETAVETMQAILREDPPPPSAIVPGLPPALDRVLLHCLERGAGGPFQSARDVGFALEAPSETSRPAVPVVPLPGRRVRGAVLVGLLAAAAAAVPAFFAGRELGRPAVSGAPPAPSF